MKILILDGSLGGRTGNTAKAIDIFSRALMSQADVPVEIDIVELRTSSMPSKERISLADAFVFASGTYWDSWGSPMQKFFEEATPLEGDDCWLGKPAALITTMHSVGGKEVLNRLHGVINTLGLFVPPMCAFTYSYANHLALQSAEGLGNDSEAEFADDLWRLDDLKTVANNLHGALTLSKNSQVQWSTWPVDSEDPNRLWLQDRPSLKR
jgi:NAD(P)H-dependent FMN reductase